MQLGGVILQILRGLFCYGTHTATLWILLPSQKRIKSCIEKRFWGELNHVLCLGLVIRLRWQWWQLEILLWNIRANVFWQLHLFRWLRWENLIWPFPPGENSYLLSPFHACLPSYHSTTPAHHGKPAGHKDGGRLIHTHFITITVQGELSHEPQQLSLKKARDSLKNPTAVLQEVMAEAVHSTLHPDKHQTNNKHLLLQRGAGFCRGVSSKFPDPLINTDHVVEVFFF